MSQSILDRLNASQLDQMSKAELRELLQAMFADLTAIRTTVAANVTDIAAIAAKLDLDGGVTDTDYAAGLTASAPAALTVTE